MLQINKNTIKKAFIKQKNVVQFIKKILNKLNKLNLLKTQNNLTNSKIISNKEVASS